MSTTSFVDIFSPYTTIKIRWGKEFAHIKQIIVRCNKVKINIRATLYEIITLPSDDEMTFGAGVRL